MRVSLLIALALASCRGGAPPAPGSDEAACENCPDAVPSHALSPTLRMPPAGGAPLVVTGTVTRGGRPAAGVALYVYHTDTTGRYTAAPGSTGLDRAHGRLRGWLRTGADGRYRIETIRPAAYPGFDDPQHLHVTVHAPGAPARWIDDIVFADDPRLTDAWLARQEQRGGPGLVRPRRDSAGVWHAVRDIDLDR